MKRNKFVLWIIIVFILILSLSSCGTDNDNNFSISFYYIVDGGRDFNYSRVYSLNSNEVDMFLNKNEESKSLNDSYSKIDDAKFYSWYGYIKMPFDIFVSVQRFDMYIDCNALVDIKYIELETKNDITINGVYCKKNTINEIQIETFNKYIKLSIDLKEFTNLEFLSVKTEDGKKYDLTNSYNKINLISTYNLVSFSSDFNSFTVNEIENVEELTVIRDNLSFDIDNTFSFTDSNTYIIKYVYNIDDIKYECEREYKKEDNCLYYISVNDRSFNNNICKLLIHKY